MPKYYGSVGFVIEEELRPGVCVEKIVERQYYGDLVRNYRRLEGAQQLNDNIKISNSFSIVMDPFAYNNFHSIRYIEYMGVKWKVESVDASNPPRLTLDAGSVYNADEIIGEGE